jgi:PPOX class probable F420-dependent enzyme
MNTGNGRTRGKQRSRIQMTDQEVTEFMHEQRTLIMSTFAPDGTIHSVAMWYDFVGEVLGTTTKAKSQKARNLRRDSRITCLSEAGTTYQELRGVELVGHAELVDDRDTLWAVAVSNHERHNGPLTDAAAERLEQAMANRVAVLIHPDKVVTWDHRKLTLSPHGEDSARA